MKTRHYGVGLIMALIISLVYPAFIQGQFTAFAAGKMIYTKHGVQGSGNGTEESPYAKFEDALKAADDGDTIVIDGSGFMNDDQRKPLVIEKNITIKSKTNAPATLNNRRSGIVLHADVVFQNINIQETNGEHPAIYANGHNLTLRNVTSEKSAAQINVFAGGLKTNAGYHGGKEPGADGNTIVIEGPEAFGGTVFLGGENMPQISNNDVTLRVKNLVSGKIKKIYGHGADSANFNPDDWFSNLGNVPQPEPNTQYAVQGKVTVDLLDVSTPDIDLEPVEGATKVNYNATQNYSDTGVLKGIDTLNVLGGNLNATELTYGDDGLLNLTVGTGATFDVSSKDALPNGNLTVDDFTGGGTIVLPREPNHFSIAGTVDETKQTTLELAGSNEGFNISNNQRYVEKISGNLPENTFQFPPGYANYDRKLVKKADGWYTNDVITIFYDSENLEMGVVEPGEDVFEVGKKPSSVRAIPKPGYKFLHWADRNNTKQYSTEAIFTPKPNDDGSYEIEYFAYFEKEDVPSAPKTFTVTYEATEGGTIDKQKEEVNKDESPKGVNATEKTDYFFKYFTADKNVTLKKDNKEIKAGSPLSKDEIKDIAVKENLTIKANFEKIRDFGTVKTKEGVELETALGKDDDLAGETLDIIDDGGYTSNVSNTYDVKVKTPDYKNEGLVIWKGKVVVDEKPSIKANDVTVPFGTEFDEALKKTGLVVTDKEDGNIAANNVEVYQGGYDKEFPETYIVNLQVRDSIGNVAKKSVKITVLPKVAPEKLPTIDAENKEVRVIPGTSLEKAAEKAKITAKSKDGSDITQNIKLESNGGYNPKMPGKYKVVYSIEESGKKATVEVTIQVTDLVKKTIPLANITLTGDTPESPRDFTVELKTENASSPVSSKGLKQTVKGAGDLNFGEFTFDTPGVYIYKVSQTGDKAENYTYDSEEYTLKYTVSDNDGELSVVSSVTKSDGSVQPESAKLIFTNSYKKPAAPNPPISDATEYNITVKNGKVTKVGAVDGEKNKIKAGELVSIKADKAPEGKLFDKWVEESGNGLNITNVNAEATSFTMPESDVVVKATYRSAPVPPAPKQHKITYDLGGGTLDGNTGKITEMVNEGTVIKLPKAPTREGYKFTYWKGSRYQPGDSYVVTEDHTFTAEWEKTASKPDNNMSLQNGKKPIEKKIVVTKKVIKSAPKTGDNSNMILWGLALVCALVMAAVAVIIKKKHI